MWLLRRVRVGGGDGEGRGALLSILKAEEYECVLLLPDSMIFRVQQCGGEEKIEIDRSRKEKGQSKQGNYCLDRMRLCDKKVYDGEVEGGCKGSGCGDTGQGW